MIYLIWRGSKIEFPFQHFLNEPKDPEISMMIAEWCIQNKVALLEAAEKRLPNELQQAFSQYIETTFPGLPLIWCRHIAQASMMTAIIGGFRIGADVGYQE